MSGTWAHFFWPFQASRAGLSAISFLQPFNLHNVVKDLLRLIPGYPYAPLSAIPTVAGLAAIGACVTLGLEPRTVRRRLGLRAHVPRRVSRRGFTRGPSP